MRRRWIWWGIPLVLCVAAVVVPVLVVYHQRTVPFDQCSEVYKQYHDYPGIRAAYIRDKQINDTLFLDMTLLQAKDSLTFVELLKSAGRSEEYINDMMISVVDENTRFTGLKPKGKLTPPIDPIRTNNDVVSIFPALHSIAIFHIKTDSEIDAVYVENFREKIKIATL